MRPCISLRGLSVRPLVGWTVTLSSKSMKKWPFTDCKWFRRCLTRKKEGRGGRGGEEEGVTRREEEGRGTTRNKRRGGTSDKESEKDEKVVKKMKKWLKDASLSPAVFLELRIGMKRAILTSWRLINDDLSQKKRKKNAASALQARREREFFNLCYC